MRLTVLFLFISQIAFGQAHLLMGLNRQREASIATTPTIYTLIDDDTYGTGTNQVEYTGSWVHAGNKVGAYEGSFSYGNTTNGTVVVDFDGVGIDLFVGKYPTHGIAAVKIDGGAETMVDLFAPSEVTNFKAISFLGLTDGAHTLTVRVTGTSNAEATGTPQQHWVEVDAFGIYSTTENPPPVVTGDIYVAKTGCSGACSDSNTGLTRAGAKLTIQAAASMAQPGDIIRIYAGTYNETITPNANGTAGNHIIYSAAEAGVIISGLEDVGTTGWTVYSGNIYQKSITLPVDNATGLNANLSNNTTLGGNQLFKSGTAMIRARWPNAATFEAQFTRTNNVQRQQTTYWDDDGIYNAQTNPGGTNTNELTDPDIPLSSGLIGATLWFQGWYQAGTMTIDVHSGSTIETRSANKDQRMMQYYHIEGALGLLDIANEWHYNPTTNVLYAWQTGGGSPTGLQYKARNWGFDLSNKSYITIEGVTFLGCEVMGNTSTTNCTIDNIRANYPNYVKMMDARVQGYGDVIYWNTRQSGFRLLGTNNTIKNSEIRYAMGMGIMAGPNALIQNNLIEYINPNADYAGPVGLYHSADGVRLLYNTMRYTGRGSFDWGEDENGTHFNVEIGYCDISNWNMLSYDGGGIYGGRNIRTTGSVLHHLWVHDGQAQKVPNISHSGSADHNVGICAGIYFDQAVGPTTTHHVVGWNNYECDYHIWHDMGGNAQYGDTQGQPRNSGKSWIYNNTFATNAGDNYYSHRSYLTVDTNPANLDVFRNNITLDDIVVNFAAKVNGSAGADIANGIQEATNPLFAGGLPTSRTHTYDGSGNLVLSAGSGTIASPQTYFLLQSGSPARNGGATLAGINDGDTAPKDIGAYWYGQTAWVPGYSAVTYVPTP